MNGLSAVPQPDPNDGREYERFVHDIYQSILKEEGTAITARCNAQVTGKSGRAHQIDIYWEFMIAGIRHRAAIECKCYSEAVPIGKVRDFHDVLSDIGNIEGMMVSPRGFQEGAREYAEFYGINLYECRRPTEEDWVGRVKDVHLHMTFLWNRIKARHFDVDTEWIRAAYPETRSGKVAFQMRGLTDELVITDGSGNRVASILDLDNSLPGGMKAVSDLTHVYEYADAYINTDKGRVKIKAVRYEYDVVADVEEAAVRGEQIVAAILKDVRTGSMRFFDQDGRARG
jgi:hypothetical protein